MTLIPIEDLRQAQDRFFARRAKEQRERHEREAKERERARELEEQNQAQELHSVAGFEYRSRSAQQWEDRAHQSFDLRIGKKRKKVTGASRLRKKKSLKQ
jgi:hypothetical protein